MDRPIGYAGPALKSMKLEVTEASHGSYGTGRASGSCPELDSSAAYSSRCEEEAVYHSILMPGSLLTKENTYFKNHKDLDKVFWSIHNRSYLSARTMTFD